MPEHRSPERRARAERAGRRTTACLLVALSAVPALGTDWLERGDAAFGERARGSESPGTALAASIDPAIDAYSRALADRPENLETRIRLLRAIFFKGEYVPAGTTERRLLFEHGREVFEQGLETLDDEYDVRNLVKKERYAEAAERLAEEPLAGTLFFWGAVHWGLWGQYFGTMASIRKGVAKKIRTFGEMALELDPEVDQGGPYRLLGRLHAIAPRVPLFTSWVDRELAADLLEKAVETAPRDPLNRFFLAEAILDHPNNHKNPGDEERALSILCTLNQEQPRSERLVEDQKALGQVRDRLEQERSRSNQRRHDDPCLASSAD